MSMSFILLTYDSIIKFLTFIFSTPIIDSQVKNQFVYFYFSIGNIYIIYDDVLLSIYDTNRSLNKSKIRFIHGYLNERVDTYNCLNMTG